MFRISYLLLTLPLVVIGNLGKVFFECLRILLISLVIFAVVAESQNSAGGPTHTGELGDWATKMKSVSFAEVSRKSSSWFNEVQSALLKSYERIGEFLNRNSSEELRPACLRTYGKEVSTSHC